MRVSKNFEFVGISLLLLIGLAACGKQAATEEAKNTNSSQSPRDIAIAKLQQLAQYNVDFAKSSKPNCQAASDDFNSAMKMGLHMMGQADNIYKQDGSTDAYKEIIKATDTGIAAAQAIPNCP